MNAQTEHEIAQNEPHLTPSEPQRAPNEPEVTRTWHEIDALESLDVAALKARYLELFGEAAPSRHRQVLVRRIAWRLQALAEGDLSERARQRAAAIARDADLRLTAPRSPRDGFPLLRRGDRDLRLPAPGTILTRRFEDHSITVEVLEKGFRYEGVVYRSLSAVARKISGTQWNGFLFFASALNGGGRKA
jgi:Protein of unknown function (DUF2924)